MEVGISHEVRAEVEGRTGVRAEVEAGVLFARLEFFREAEFFLARLRFFLQG